MSIGEKINSFIRNRKMTVDQKIEYLTYLYEDGINFNTIPDNYATKEKVLVKNVIRNIQRLYDKDKLSIKQILNCEKIGISFELKNNINDKIKFLQKAKEEGISLSNIIQNTNEYSNTIIFKYICDLRKDFKEDKLNLEQIYKCEKELKIIISEEEQKKIILKKVKESALKNITFSQQIEEVLGVN